jgi:hypothetical protein
MKLTYIPALLAALSLSIISFQPNTAQADHLSTTQQMQIQQNLSAIETVLMGLCNTYNLDCSMDADMTSDNPTQDVDSPAANLRVSLNKLLQEHATLSLDVLRSIYNESDDVSASNEELDENTVELAATIGSVYGDDAEEQFREIWREHIVFFANHTVGLRDDDDDMVDEALEDLEGYREEIADFFSSAIPSVERETVIAGAGEHADLLTSSMEAYDDEDYMEAYELQREGAKQMQGIADLLSNGIVMQFPEQF